MVNNTVDKLKKLQAEAQGALDEAALARQEERQDRKSTRLNSSHT